MRQVRLVIVAGIGVLALCGIALMGALVSYVSHPEVANAHLPPVVGTPAPSPPDQAPLATPIITSPVDTPPSAAPQPVAGELPPLLQQFQGRRHRPPRH
jgi:hypothetical protein